MVSDKLTHDKHNATKYVLFQNLCVVMKKFEFLIISIVSSLLCSCSSEKSKMQALLIEYLGAENQKVEIIDYQVKELITCNNIKDSIFNCQFEIDGINEIYIDQYKSEIEKYKQIIKKNLANKAKAPYFLMHDWDNINKTYYGFIDEYEEKIELRQDEIDKINAKKILWENLIYGKDKVDEVFTKYKINYTIDGKVSHCVLNITPDFKLFNLDNYENESN